MRRVHVLGAAAAMVAGLGVASLGLAGDFQIQRPTPDAIKALAIPCPAGWHATPGSSQTNFTCVPNKPAPIKCPPGTSYIATDCAVGCRPVIK